MERGAFPVKIPESGRVAKSAGTSRAYLAQTGGAAQLQKRGAARRFDSVTISQDGPSVFEMELRSRLTQEVRTATSSGMVSELRRQVQSGNYQPDPMAIARKMYLLGEDA